MREEVLQGLSRGQKVLPPKLLYDKRGSEIFEKICLLKEYYPTRAESEILRTYAGEIGRLIGEKALVIEPGSGAGDKIRYLLPHLVEPVGYVPIEISEDILLRTTEEISAEYLQLQVIPVCADFTQEFELPRVLEELEAKKVIFFPGSTIGNFTPFEAIQFLKKMGQLIEPGEGLLIGVDLKKDLEALQLAYDDPHGVTAAFNLNILERLNREAGATFCLQNFSHQALYNEKLNRVEMHLVSQVPQVVRVFERIFRFQEGETIHTECSYKYSVDDFAALCSRASFSLKKTWKDSQNLFSVHFFEKEL